MPTLTLNYRRQYIKSKQTGQSHSDAKLSIPILSHTPTLLPLVVAQNNATTYVVLTNFE